MKYGLIALLIVFTAQGVWADALYRKAKKGNRQYTEKKYGEALNTFLDAQVEAPESPQLHYDLGCAYFKQRQYDKAVEAFDKVLSAKDIELVKKAAFNKGDALYRQGEDLVQTGKQEGVQKLQEAIEAYKKVLEFDPQNQPAKVNIQFVQRKLKEMAKPQDQKQQNQNQQQQNQKPPEPSEHAKQVKKQAEELVKQGRYQPALQLMEQLAKEDQTAAAFQEFTNRVKDLAGIKKG
jgi:tetratricopeptide (TPR) repeat protein